MPHYENHPADWNELIGKTIVYMDPTEGDDTVNFMCIGETKNDRFARNERTYYTIWFNADRQWTEYKTGLTKRVLAEDGESDAD